MMSVKPYIMALVSMFVINASIFVTYLHGHAYLIAIMMMMGQHGEQGECHCYYTEEIFAH